MLLPAKSGRKLSAFAYHKIYIYTPISIIPKPQIVSVESNFGVSRWDGWKNFIAPFWIFHYGHTLYCLVAGVILLLTPK